MGVTARHYPVKPLNDPKDYLALELDNGLKLFLVTDPDCDKAAVSLSLGVGSMSDPDEIPGLAHLCEHLLSLDVNNTPGYKPFNSFVAENGGLFNAFTSRDQTNFYFDLGASALPEALQRFAKFFTFPHTLTENDIAREITIIDAEHETKINKEAWRKMGVDASTANKIHPFYKFTTGNKKTLSDVPIAKGISVLKAVLNFRANYYVSRLMAVVVYGKDTLKFLEDLCIALFSVIRDNINASLPQWDDGPYGTHELQQRIDVVAMAEIRDFYMVFPTADTRPYYKTFPHGYITRLLGNRGPGSLYSYLYEKQWVESSYMTSSIPARGFGELSIGFQLTEVGLNHVDEIILCTFEYIKMLKRQGPQKYFWQEMQEILKLPFLYPEKEIPVEFVQRTSNLMHVYPLADVLCIGNIVTEYDPDLLDKFLNYLCPANCRVVTVCKENECLFNTTALQDHWYGVRYHARKFTDEEIQLWSSCEFRKEFTLPRKNEFIPTDFTLKNKNATQSQKQSTPPFYCFPVGLVDIPLCKAWFLEQDYFHEPRGVIRVEFFSPLPLADALAFTLNEMWFLIVKNVFSDYYYQATVSGSFHDIKPMLYGAEITVSGYTHKLILLMEKIFSYTLQIHQDMDVIRCHFKTVKDRYADGLKNFKNRPPNSMTAYYLSLLLREKRFSNDELLEALNDVNEEMLVNYVKAFFFRTFFEWLFVGNFTKQEAESLICSCMTKVREQWNTRALFPCQMPRMREICINSEAELVYQDAPLKSGSACAYFVQIGVLNLYESVILELIDQITFEPIFSQLRNRQQIGYVVRSSVRKSNGCQGLLVFVQGEESPQNMGESIRATLQGLENHIAKMSDHDFTQHKTSVMVRKSDRPKTMLSLANKIWNNEIYTRLYEFMRIEKELTALQKITKGEVVAFYRKHITSASSRKLQIHLTPTTPTIKSNKERANTGANDSGCGKPGTPRTVSPGAEKTKSPSSESSSLTIISDVTKWKLRMGLYPNLPFE